jgi:hypothetical protein
MLRDASILAHIFDYKESLVNGRLQVNFMNEKWVPFRRLSAVTRDLPAQRRASAQVSHYKHTAKSNQMQRLSGPHEKRGGW